MDTTPTSSPIRRQIRDLQDYLHEADIEHTGRLSVGTVKEILLSNFNNSKD